LFPADGGFHPPLLNSSLSATKSEFPNSFLELIDCLLIIDDLKGRNLAEQLGVKVTGTFGLIIEAKISGYIESVKPLLEKIKQTNFRLSKDLEERILLKAQE